MYKMAKVNIYGVNIGIKETFYNVTNCIMEMLYNIIDCMCMVKVVR
jgi:hypothetical protein